MFEVLFLGTAASSPSIHRGLAAHVVMVKDYRFLVDCGEGTQRQILRSGIGFRRLNRVLITHGHLDHIYGLGGLLSTLIRWGENAETWEIYGGRWALERIHDLLFEIVLKDEQGQLPINLIEIRPGLIFEDQDFSITAFPVTHRGPGCFGFIFQEQARRPFLNDKASELGIPIGPERAKLVRGESVTLADGRVIQPDDVLGADLPGARYVHIGDVGRTDNIVQYVKDAHALVIEATYLDSESEMARSFGHMTAAQAAQLAAEANVKTLILTHISHRNRERDVLAEAQAIFPNTYVARDFDRYSIAKDRLVERISPKRHQEPVADQSDEVE